MTLLSGKNWRECNVFIGVCHFVHGGASIPQCNGAEGCINPTMQWSGGECRGVKMEGVNIVGVNKEGVNMEWT